MAAHQRTEKEDTDFKAPPLPVLPLNNNPCSNDCGLAGSPSTNNRCQKCFNQSSPSTTTSDRDNPTRSRSPPPPHRKPRPVPVSSTPTLQCSGCSRKVGLTGFRCRCGELFYADPRYSDRHDCSYDYKATGRGAISREKPVVKAAKIVRV